LSDIIVMEEALKRVANNEKLFHRLLGKFNGRELQGEITAAVDGGDYEAAAKACHTLRGLASNLAMHPLAESVMALEGKLKAGEAPADMLAALDSSIAAVEQEIKNITD